MTSAAHIPNGAAAPGPSVDMVDGRCSTRFAVFSECPHCGGRLHPEHAHYKCAACGWRDSCCD